MQKPKFTTLISTAIPIPVENIDTDQIIPARFLKGTTREGFGEHLFHDWRFDLQGNTKPFVLNDKKYKGEILVAGKNFGCGSSREHAAWALYDYGFRVVVSSFFADIFKNNALNNSLLPIVISHDKLQSLLSRIKSHPETEITVDLPNQKIQCMEISLDESFDINPYKKECIVNGYDDVDYLLSHKQQTIDFEKSRNYPVTTKI